MAGYPAHRLTRRLAILTTVAVSAIVLLILGYESRSRLYEYGRQLFFPFQGLKKLGADRQVQAIRYCRDSYYVTTADGKTADFWEADLRFKTDSSNTGPPAGKPAIMPAGMQGDRASVFFASPERIAVPARTGASLQSDVRCRVSLYPATLCIAF